MFCTRQFEWQSEDTDVFHVSTAGRGQRQKNRYQNDDESGRSTVSSHTQCSSNQH